MPQAENQDTGWANWVCLYYTGLQRPTTCNEPRKKVKAGGEAGREWGWGTPP